MMQAWTFKPLCMHSYSLPLFKIGLLCIDSFNKYTDTALWYWTHSVMKCASIKKACKERLQCTGLKCKHFIALCLESHWLSWVLPSMFPVPAKERIPSKFSSVCLEQLGLWGRVISDGPHQSHSQVWLRESQILATVCPLLQLFAGGHCCTSQE